METKVATTIARDSNWYIEAGIFIGALLLYGMLPSNNNNYADDSLRWAYSITRESGLINSHHMYLNAMREAYHALYQTLGVDVDPVRLLTLYSTLWGAIGLVALYRLLQLVGCGRAALPGVLLCAFTTNYWSYSIVSDVYIPATALLVVGIYAFLNSLKATSSRQQAGWAFGAIMAFVLMILHHQAYFVFVIGISAAALLVRNGSFGLRLKQCGILLAMTGFVSLAIYGTVYQSIPELEGKRFSSFIAGYADESSSFYGRPDQKSVSLATLVNATNGQLRAIFPYYVIFRSDSLTRAIQQRFPYRNVYQYPYLVRSLTLADVALILISAAVASLAGTILLLRGIVAAVRERKETLVILLAMVPQAIFFIWWEGLSDEFWVWSLPLIALLATKGAAIDERWGLKLLSAGVAGLFVSSLLGAVLLFSDPDNDIDAVNRRYLAGVGPTDLLIGFDEIQSAARARLARKEQGFRYVNLYDYSFPWSSAKLAELDHEIANTLARGGRIIVDSYVPHPPKSLLVLIGLRNPKFGAARLEILAHLKAVNPTRIEWIPQAATVPGYFVD